MADKERDTTVKSDKLRDEMVPDNAMPTTNRREGRANAGERDTAGEHGDLAVESAAGLESSAEEKE